MEPSMYVARPLYGHTSPETAYHVDDYPYGFRLRTEIRYWLETNKHGTRFVSQTRNPKRADRPWNKPKASTYAPVACMYLDGNGHVQWSGLGIWPTASAVRAFLANFPGMPADTRGMIATIVAASRSMCKRLAATYATGSSGWTVNGVPTELRPEQVTRNAAELAEWEAIAAEVTS